MQCSNIGLETVLTEVFVIFLSSSAYTLRKTQKYIKMALFRTVFNSAYTFILPVI